MWNENTPPFIRPDTDKAPDGLPSPGVEQKPVPEEEHLDDDVIEMPTFSYDGYQVVRQEFFAHTREPSLTFNGNKVYVNSYCLSKLPNVTFVQFLVNPDDCTLIIRPCEEDEKNAVRWRIPSEEKHKVRQITGRIFIAMIVNLMQWNPAHRYKLLGKIIRSRNEILIFFDLKIPEIYQRMDKDGEKPKISRTAVLPANMLNQFGLTFQEHQRLRQISIFEGYTVFSVQDESSRKSEGSEADREELAE